MSDRMIDLETKVAFLEGSLAEYDQLFQELYQKIDCLTQEVKRLAEEQKSSIEPFSIQNEKPPHY